MNTKWMVDNLKENGNAESRRGFQRCRAESNGNC